MEHWVNRRRHKKYEPKDWLKFTAITTGSVSFTIVKELAGYVSYIEYSTDNGITWVRKTSNSSSNVTLSTPSIAAGKHVFFRGWATAFATLNTSLVVFEIKNNCYFSGSGTFKLSGNMGSLTGRDNFTRYISNAGAYARLFSNRSFIKEIDIIVYTSFSDYAFYLTFYYCTALTSIKCNFRSNSKGAYYYMFSYCTNLTTIQLTMLPVPSYEECFLGMFSNCSKLTTTYNTIDGYTTAKNCFTSMYSNTAVTSVPSWVTLCTLSEYCFRNMFSNTKVTSAPLFSNKTMYLGCFLNMFSGCTSLTYAGQLLATTLANYCYNSMFYGCTALTTPPTIAATTLASSCCSDMFKGCTSLTTAPVLKATTLVSSCYKNMFLNCSKLNYIKALFTTTPSSTYTSNWVSGVAASGTFYKKTGATWSVTGVHGIPDGWTVRTASS